MLPTLQIKDARAMSYSILADMGSFAKMTINRTLSPIIRSVGCSWKYGFNAGYSFEIPILTMFHKSCLLFLLVVMSFAIIRMQKKANCAPIIGRGLQRISSIATLRHMRDLFHEGFKKHPDSAFRIQVFPFGRVTVLTNRKLVEEMRRTPADILSFDEVSCAVILPNYTCFGTAPGHHQVVVIQNHLSKRLNSLIPDMSQEIEAVTNDFLGPSTTWRDVVVYSFARQVMSRISLCAMFGLPLCRSLELESLVLSFVEGATRSAFWINMFPTVFHGIVGPLISPMNQYRKRIERIITPLIDERRQKLREYGDDWSEKPYDFLMCLIEAAPSGQNYESSYEGIATRLLQFCFATIHTSIHTISHLLLDLASSPQIVDVLREEIIEVLDGEHLTKRSMQKFRCMDSFMRESARMNPVGVTTDRLCSIGLTNLCRFANQEYTFSDCKTVVKKGSVVMASMNSVHRDPESYPNPDSFEPWRFVDIRAKVSDASSHQFVSTSPNYLFFGHGRRACPGRYYADAELKAVLCHMILNYDLRIAGSIRPQNNDLGIGVLPDMNAKIEMKRRKL